MRVGGKNTVGNGLVCPYISTMKTNRAKYRRRRLGTLFVAGALAVAAYTAGGVGAEPPAAHYTVAPGDTLWGIAIEPEGRGHPRRQRPLRV